ncbi:uncharacterized protein LOC107036626 [Diachasma alloeum]|uniref:uncharacterized protein LOC107036626 n=1 Tax=Diachasma alloeum TaxID=454923 RepID=UPI00073835D4|nr:uncharacterized protein LOC107036626 [Diachasma alloeum]
MSGVENHVLDLFEAFHANITVLWANYGPDRSQHFQEKYGPKGAEFAANPKLSKDCPRYIADLLDENKKHQDEMSEYFSKAVDTWNIEFNSLYATFVNNTEMMALLKMEIYHCGILLVQEDLTLPFNCVNEVLERVTKAEEHAVEEIVTKAANLLERNNNTLTSLHHSIQDRFIPYFYNETGIDMWLSIYCPDEQQKASS